MNFVANWCDAESLEDLMIFAAYNIIDDLISFVASFRFNACCFGNNINDCLVFLDVSITSIAYCSRMVQCILYIHHL